MGYRTTVFCYISSYLKESTLFLIVFLETCVVFHLMNSTSVKIGEIDPDIYMLQCALHAVEQFVIKEFLIGQLDKQITIKTAGK